MQSWKTVSAAIAVRTSCLISIQPAAAAPTIAAAGGERLTAEAALPLEAVQYRRWHGGYRNHGWHYRRHYGTGPAVLGGLAAGALIGGAIK
jgi:hypothetical protein